VEFINELRNETTVDRINPPINQKCGFSNMYLTRQLTDMRSTVITELSASLRKNNSGHVQNVDERF